jgi:hypothetical protein
VAFPFLVLHVAAAWAVLISLGLALTTADLTWRRVETVAQPLAYAEP